MLSWIILRWKHPALSSKELTHFRERVLHSIYSKQRAVRDSTSILVSESAICDWGIWKHWQLPFLSYILKINACLSSKDSFFFVNITCGYWETKITRNLLKSIYLYSYYHDKLLFQSYSFTSLPKPLVSWSLVYKSPINLHHTFVEPQQFIKIVQFFVHFCCTTQFMYFLRNSCHHRRMISYASLASRFMVSQR